MFIFAKVRPVLTKVTDTHTYTYTDRYTHTHTHTNGQTHNYRRNLADLPE